MYNNKLEHFIKSEASRLGFFYCGFSRADFLEDHALLLEVWLANNHHGKMKYMENHFDKRLDPRLLVEGAKSVITLLYNYFPSNPSLSESRPKISRYAYGEDYHFVIKELLAELMESIGTFTGNINARVFTDSAPVLEKAWAQKSGAGWIGKNSNLITRKQGSYFFIAEIISDLSLTPDEPIQDYCGTCSRCLDACPTGAIIKPYTVDGSRCISYFTIELKDEIPETQKGNFDDWVFGCDICQEVCPWNRFSIAHRQPRFNATDGMLRFHSGGYKEITEEDFNKTFSDSPLKRTGYKGILRNLKFVSEISGKPE